jgi:2-polyprenyl-6-methoxyphenol hydroxylase-like FAD-dependent oxidoreductase
MTEETDVAVVGAGGGGAVLALALAKQGIRTVVLDQATGPPKGLRGEILQPNGQRVLDRLGVLQSLPAAPLQHRLWRPTPALQSRHRHLAQRGPSCHCRGGAAAYECDIALWDLILRAGP